MMPARRYQAVAQNTASRERLLVLLLQRAHALMEQTAVALENSEAKLADDALDKALAIVTELSDTLDPSKGQALCTALGEVYAFVIWKLVQARRSRSADDVRAAARSLRPIVEAFEAAVAQVGTGAQHGAR
jgi:flagellar biosynthetic protein FliS